MNWEEWRHWYERIVADLHLDPDADKEAARTLDALLGTRILEPFELEELIRGREVVVFGPAPFTGNVLNDHLTISAGSSTAQMVEKDIWPDIVVTDLDGDVQAQVEANRKGAAAVIHAHGDNIASLREWVPRFGMPLLGTTQAEPEGRVANFGGFTDGDRAVFLAIHFGASRIFLKGFDYSAPIVKPHMNVARKRLKLTYARQLIDHASRTYVPGIEYL
jgi:uncharacterized Rossmann fold enzyme